MRPPGNLGFPTSAEEFYALRDDRTNRYTENRTYQKAQCAISADASALRDATGQIMLLVACNLLSRWCRHIDILVPTSELSARSFRGGLLGDEILKQMRDADPFGSFSWSDRRIVTAPLQLHVGANPAQGVKATVINASGWVATIGDHGTRLPTSKALNIVGAVGAACLGVAQVFKLAIGVSAERIIRPGAFDLLRLERIHLNATQGTGPRVTNTGLGRILLIGAGSVGSALAYCLQLAAPKCETAIIDKDLVLVENFNRSPLFGKSNFRINKAEALREMLLDASIPSAAYPMSWNEFIRSHGRRPCEFDVWLPLANEENVRASIQCNIPPLMVYAVTNSNWGTSHGRWIPGRDECLVDRFHQPTTEDQLQCSTGQVVTAQGATDAALPFLSMFAGLMVFAELLRLQLPGYPHVPNYALFDFFGALDTIQKMDSRPRSRCDCRSLPAALYKYFNHPSKYFGLSFPKSGFRS